MSVFFCDTETTGLDADLHEVWEVAAIVPEGDGWKEHQWFLPVDLGRADAVALRIGGYHQRRTSKTRATSLPIFAKKFAALTRGLHMVGAVPDFDSVRLAKLLKANGACPEWHYHLVDTEALVSGLLGIKPPWNSNDLSLAVGVDPEGFDRHTALGDARWAKAMYEAVMGWER